MVDISSQVKGSSEEDMELEDLMEEELNQEIEGVSNTQRFIVPDSQVDESSQSFYRSYDNAEPDRYFEPMGRAMEGGEEVVVGEELGGSSLTSRLERLNSATNTAKGKSRRKVRKKIKEDSAY
jgi:hypothetical protein